jgi:predicted nuclease with TOPRIM domain
MVEATDIEKKSLEAHVELCAERYNALEDKMNAMAVNISHLCEMVQEVKSSVSKLNEKNNDRLINWGIGIIGFLTASTVYLLSNYVFK